MVISGLRSIFVILLTLLLAFVLVVAVEGFSAIVHPFPADFDGSYDQVAAHVERYPGWVLAIAALMWAAIVFVSTWLATRFGSGRHVAHGIIVASLLLLAAIYNMLMLPYPIGFVVANVVLFPLAIFYGIKSARGPSGEGTQPLR